MARLSDGSHLDLDFHVSNDLLSLQLCNPGSKDRILSSFEASNPSSRNVSTIDDAQMSTQDYEYSSSSSSTRHSAGDAFFGDMENDIAEMKSRASSHSSLSSVPASVLVHPLNGKKQTPSTSLHEMTDGGDTEDDEDSFGGFDEPPKSIRTIRPREAAFRKPSSVRAMQMHTEDEADDDEYLTPPRRRPNMRSPGSSPQKRSPYYSPHASINKLKVKREFPLVLLHCNLLAPSIPVSGASEPQNQKIVEEVLPVQYWKRWRRLQDKVGSGVLRDRGVLISHPEDCYDVLEERLLESLELQRSRLHQGHFLGHEDSGPGSEGELSEPSGSETDGEQGEECPDCGGRVVRHSDSNRKWEIKVFAATGLMRAGAWAAAWKEMEKVDVEVGLWLPSDLRRALEKRLAEEAAVNPDPQPLSMAHQSVAFERNLRRLSVQAHTRTLSGTGSFQTERPPPTDFEPSHPRQGYENKSEISLQTLIINYIRVLASDKRNIALAIMSILVVSLAIGASPSQVPSGTYIHSFPRGMAESMPASSVDVAMPPASATLASSLESAMSLTPVSSTFISSTRIMSNALLPSISVAEPRMDLDNPEILVESGAEETKVDVAAVDATDQIGSIGGDAREAFANAIDEHGATLKASASREL